MKSIEWLGRRVRFLDQTKLPLEETFVETADYRVVAEAIRSLAIRGAPAIGVAAAYGVALAALEADSSPPASFTSAVRKACEVLSGTRPTAVNLFLAIRRMEGKLRGAGSPPEVRSVLVDEAIAIHREDEEMCRCIGERGAELVPDPATILTHCNTGALATGGSGTAQSIITSAARMGKKVRVYATETRPALQGARLTAWELMRAGIDVTLMTDSTAASAMRSLNIQLVVVGADRIAANGDTVNKIGTYALAVAARHHAIPLYVAAPTTTIDPDLASGDLIPIEERRGAELVEIFGRRIAPPGVRAYAPAFDMTPASLISAIVTERGVHRPPFDFRRRAPDQAHGKQ